jgi:thiosulfate/3-mercaptopyruvate sulfurtransferase
MAPCCFVLALVSTVLAADERATTYPRGDLLVEPTDFRKADVARGFLILDARGKASYLEGHIPGAVWLDQVTWTRSFKDGKDAEAWAKRIGELGIDGRKPVVIYGIGRSQDPARMWWILRYWGVPDVRLLNGGWQAWVKAGGESEKEPNRSRAVEFKPRPRDERLATKTDLLAALRDKPPQIVDARSLNEYCGLAETARRNGAIPGAVRLEWSDTLDRDGRFKSAEELAKLFKAAGIDPKKPAVTYCQSGGRASVVAFALELMGGEDVRNYYRSWAEWGNEEDTPIVKPRKK